MTNHLHRHDHIPSNWGYRHDNIVAHAWEAWTKNGLGMDTEDREQAVKSCRDAATNAWIDGMDDLAWLRATLARLGA